MPTVSIVLPTYNGERYIKESIDSVLHQTFSDWELIIVNDCSSDSTPEIIQEYSNRDARIHVIHNKENQKLPKSLNIGFEAACGKYLTWTSDDNYYLPNAIEQMVGYLNDNPNIYLVSASMNSMDAEGHLLGKIYSYDEADMYYNDSVGACFMYRNDVLQELGGYDSSFFLVEDYEYWLRIFFRYGKIGKIEDVLYVYRFHEQSLTATKAAEIRKQLLRLRQKYINNILDGGCRKDYLCRIYYEFIEMGIDITQYKAHFLAQIPELSLDIGMDKDRLIIVYGAGDYGNRAYERFGSRIAYYVDKDIEKCGNIKNGKKILSIDEMVTLKDDYQILIAISIEKIYGILSDFYKNGITQCCVYQNL